jgi:tetratricopeptide (TPR) repeat protein
MNSKDDLIQVQEYLGTALLLKEDYAAALQHLSSALQLAQALPAGDNRNYYLSIEIPFYAQALLNLGRIQDAQLAINLNPQVETSDAKLAFAIVRAQLLNTQGRYQEALTVLNKASVQNSTPVDQRWDFYLALASALAHTGDPARAIMLCDQILQPGGAESQVAVVKAKLTKATILLRLGKWQLARSLTEDTEKIFAASGQHESQLLSLAVTTRAAKENGYATQAADATKKMRDILATLEHNYGTANYNLFVKRSEIAEIVPGV